MRYGAVTSAIFAAGVMVASATSVAEEVGGNVLPARFSSEGDAQQHCPNDTVVWLNTATNIYHFKGRMFYGVTKDGAFVCKKEADKAGDLADLHPEETGTQSDSGR